MFAWAGIPLFFAVVVHLTYRVVGNNPPGDHSADSICLVILFLSAVGATFLVRERLRPRAAWVVPVYASLMLVLLFVVLGLVSLQFTGGL